MRVGQLICPKCDSDEVAVTAEQMFMVNTGEHYCHSVKTQDDDAKATCLACRWTGKRKDLSHMDDYGNPVSGDRIINCCFPDCGCDGARLCMAENGASTRARSMNIERGPL